MLQVNDSLQELQLADCDLVKWRAGCCNHEIVPILRLVSDPPQATQSVIELAIALQSNKSLRSVDISRPLLFSLQVRTL